MTLLDRYVGRIVLGAFVVTQVFFVFISVVLDLLISLPKYASRAAEVGLGGIDLAFYLAEHYAKGVPVIFVGVTPVATVIAAMFAVARLQSANEFVPMLFVGRSMSRVLRPMLFCGALAGLAMAACWQWVVPRFGESIAASEAFLRQGNDELRVLVYENREERQHLYVHVYDPRARRMTGVRMLVRGLVETDTIVVTADQATWDRERRDWRLEGGKILKSGAGFVDERPQQWLERADVTPEKLMQRGREELDPDTQSYSDLLATIELRPNRADMRMALHRHITYPLANILLLLLALPLAVHFERGSRIDRILGAIGLCGAYMFFDLICTSLGRQGHLDPIVAAWTPTIVFGALGITLFGSARS